MEKKLNFKILTSIFIILFSIIFFSNYSQAINLDHYEDIMNYVNNSTYYNGLINQYDYCTLFYRGLNGNSISYYFLFSNNQDLNITSPETLNNNVFSIEISNYNNNYYVYYYNPSGRVFDNQFNYGSPLNTSCYYEDSFVNSISQCFIPIKRKCQYYL